MLSVISPAKSLDFSSPLPKEPWTEPRFLDQTLTLAQTLKGFSPGELGRLMGLSEKLSELNHQRYQSFALPLASPNARPALWAFDGDVYQGIGVASLQPKERRYLNQKVRVLSGFYGLLRPFDLILPYRLEMGTKLATAQAKDLYGFWGPDLTLALKTELLEHSTEVLVNLASQEYFKAIQPKLLGTPVVCPEFLDPNPQGQLKVISFFAKKARGLMCRFIAQEGIDRPQGLLDFALEGYRYAPKLSKPEKPVFTREKQT
ncbi:MAG: hypothetical protein A2600_12105 [Candidatus Lambdaproteobacteria bacterium RIFOXYD1_FULL_56_27]|uniref:UPF0246 protein A2557_11440 n=1 Tax=Candidatus Lambdaproteobacteria bacterium RIFOXYD2_FULL_56_26 TaxID=1817773 RepID=A0A1F6GXD4_9PROT|nr:MAG: hypothetical protein A2426_08970 [Candidatus Lambdaproteobacteria bacterium RIFOXYC1_FULL_56_13]OGH02690.1 MAG: hypothetical protein A2557_11440 [Candidatus Lambdaproteobacteria bacterium RIFOXYD2_FULL_56_26]OGH07989.1 MAG: hypothetical protein A2600_12105 [Candidatus Lambdaproteobacteria bacterium RIFOXYD1_FULL_56_27]